MSVNVDWMKVYVIQKKKNRMIDGRRTCNYTELDDWSSCKDSYMCNPSTYYYECNKAWILTNI